MKLTNNERVELQRQASASNGRADSARRARLILLLAQEHTWAEIRAKLDCSDSYIDRWSKRFAADRLSGLFARHAPLPDLGAMTDERIVECHHLAGIIGAGRIRQGQRQVHGNVDPEVAATARDRRQMDAALGRRGRGSRLRRVASSDVRRSAKAAAWRGTIGA